jgi:hypothetical protein
VLPCPNDLATKKSWPRRTAPLGLCLWSAILANHGPVIDQRWWTTDRTLFTFTLTLSQKVAPGRLPLPRWRRAPPPFTADGVQLRDREPELAAATSRTPEGLQRREFPFGDLRANSAMTRTRCTTQATAGMIERSGEHGRTTAGGFINFRNGCRK